MALERPDTGAATRIPGLNNLILRALNDLAAVVRASGRPAQTSRLSRTSLKLFPLAVDRAKDMSTASLQGVSLMLPSSAKGTCVRLDSSFHSVRLTTQSHLSSRPSNYLTMHSMQLCSALAGDPVFAAAANVAANMNYDKNDLASGSPRLGCGSAAPSKVGMRDT